MVHLLACTMSNRLTNVKIKGTSRQFVAAPLFRVNPTMTVTAAISFGASRRVAATVGLSNRLQVLTRNRFNNVPVFVDHLNTAES